MLEEICIIFITISTCSLGFNLSCPGSGQWTFRAMVYCSDLNMYTCLLDTTKSRYTETCDGDRKEIDGQKTTINRNNFDAAKCKLDRFQPMDFTTVGNSDCVFQKTKCEQEGQIAGHEIKEKTSVLDTNCLCDYTKGYSFINIPQDKCYCSPSVDDCSCFREFCPSGKILSPDYQCTTQIDMKNRKWNCSKIASADESQNGDQVQQSIDPKNERWSRMAVQVIVPILVLIMAGLLIWCWKTSKLDKVKERIICLVCEKDDDNESEKMTTETQHSPEKNDKIQHKLPEKDNANESEEIIIPTEITLASDKNDKIQYESYEKDDDDKSEAINLSTEFPYSPDKNDEIQHELSSQRDSKTSVCDLSSSQEELKYNQIDGRKTDQISQTKQNDSSSSEDDDDLSFKSTQSSITGLVKSEDKNRVTNNSKAFEKHHLDKSDDSVDKISTVEENNEMIKEYKQLDTTTKDIGDITEESNEENCMVEAEENKNKKNEELSTFANVLKDKSDDPVELAGTVLAEIEKTSTKQHKEKSDRPVEKISTDEANYNTIKENEELNTYSKANTDNEPVKDIATLDDENENSEEYSKLDTSEEDSVNHINESDARKSVTDNKKPSGKDITDHSEESEAKKPDTENKKPSEQNSTDHSDESDARMSDTENKKLNESKLEMEDTDKSVKTDTHVATEKSFASLLDDF